MEFLYYFQKAVLPAWEAIYARSHELLLCHLFYSAIDRLIYLPRANSVLHYSQKPLGHVLLFGLLRPIFTDVERRVQASNLSSSGLFTFAELQPFSIENYMPRGEKCVVLPHAMAIC